MRNCDGFNVGNGFKTGLLCVRGKGKLIDIGFLRSVLHRHWNELLDGFRTLDSI